MYIQGVLFVRLFINFACELIWSVLVIQKGFQYITLWSKAVSGIDIIYGVVA